MDGMKEVFRDITAYWEKSETPEIFNKRKFIARPSKNLHKKYFEKTRLESRAIGGNLRTSVMA